MKSNRSKDDRGQTLVEAVVVIPFIATAVFGFIFLMGLGWLRFELGQMVQMLGACLNSTQTAHQCREDFKNTLQKFPGEWDVRSIADNFHGTRVDLHYRWRRHDFNWSLDEPKVFRLSR